MSMVETTSETNEYHMQGFIQGIFVRWGEHLAGETINPLTAVSAYLRKAEGPSQNNSLKINRSFKNPET